MVFTRNFGTHPDIPDHRDRTFAAPRARRVLLPSEVDLRPACPPVHEQGSLNSCSANAIAAAIGYDARMHDGAGVRDPSRLFVYYNERAREGLIRTNAPTSIRDGYRAVEKFGVCPERLWPYDPAHFRQKPPARCYRIALEHRAIAYFRIAPRLDQLRSCLADRYPFVMGMSVYESFLTSAVKRTGEVPMPKRSEAPTGGHAVLVVGYRDASRRFIVRNSWGRRWGHRGYFFLPYAYLLNPALAWDFWTVRRIGV